MPPILSVNWASSEILDIVKARCSDVFLLRAGSPLRGNGDRGRVSLCALGAPPFLADEPEESCGRALRKAMYRAGWEIDTGTRQAESSAADHCESISARMSPTLQQAVRGPSFTGAGKRPERTPAHQVDLQTGINAGIGGTALGFPMICGRRRKPVSGSWFIVYCFRPSWANKATGQS